MSLSPQTGVDRILNSQQAPPPREIFNNFSLAGRVAIITGAERGIGLDIAEAYAEAGAIVYCLDLPSQPGDDFKKVDAYLNSLPDLPNDMLHGLNFGAAKACSPKHKKGKLVYMQADVTNQTAMWCKAEKIGEIEGRLDICVANAGILVSYDCLEDPDSHFSKLLDVNVNGVMFTAQAAGRMMKRFGTPGSIILTASMSGSVGNQSQPWTAYHTSKGAVVQLGRSLACELGKNGIRVNTVSPGYIYSKMTKQFLDTQPGLKEKWASENPLGRIGLTGELRGTYLWLAGDGSSFCTGSDILVDGGHVAW